MSTPATITKAIDLPHYQTKVDPEEADREALVAAEIDVRDLTSLASARICHASFWSRKLYPDVRDLTLPACQLTFVNTDPVFPLHPPLTTWHFETHIGPSLTLIFYLQTDQASKEDGTSQLLTI